MLSYNINSISRHVSSKINHIKNRCFAYTYLFRMCRDLAPFSHIPDLSCQRCFLLMLMRFECTTNMFSTLYQINAIAKACVTII